MRSPKSGGHFETKYISESLQEHQNRYLVDIYYRFTHDMASVVPTTLVV